MYDLSKKESSKTLESMQEIVLLNEIMALAQKPIADSKDFVKENSEWIQVKNEKICSNIQELLSDPIKHKVFCLLQKNHLLHKKF